MSSHALHFDQVWKSYSHPSAETFHALRDVSAAVEVGSVVAIVGRSGSGKSTLLHLAAGIDEPSRGSVWVDGEEIGRLSDRARTLVRRERIGLVFQFFHLLQHLTVRDNVVLPGMIAGDRARDHRKRALELLDRVGLADRAEQRADTLSGGEMQRVAICRALLRRPKLLLADEPTGSLDDRTGRKVMQLMLELVREQGASLVYVTHSRQLARLADQIWSLNSGALETVGGLA